MYNSSNQGRGGGRSGGRGGGFQQSRSQLGHSSNTSRMQLVLNTSAATDNDKKPIWTVGLGSSQWAAKSKLIIARFLADHNCWELVDPAQAPALVPPGHPAGEPVETVFTEPVIDEAARLTSDKAAKVLLITTTFQNRIDAVTATTHPGAAAVRAAAKQELRDKRDQYNDRVEFEDGPMKATIKTACKMREDHLLKYNEKKEACIRCFNACIAQDAIGPYLEDITAGRVRKAWADMCTNFDGVVGGTSTAQSLNKELNSFTYNKAFTCNQNCEYLDLLCSQLAALGIQTNDFQRCTIFIGGVKYSAAHQELKAQADYNEKTNSTYNVTKQALITKYTQLVDGSFIQPISASTSTSTTTIKAAHTAQRVKALAKAVAKRARDADKAGGASANVGGGPVKNQRTTDTRNCTHCHKPGHTESGCWEKHPCKHCGQKGHGE
jgi:hypothetical protein